jgi:hypothetical protein
MGTHRDLETTSATPTPIVTLTAESAMSLTSEYNGAIEELRADLKPAEIAELLAGIHFGSRRGEMKTIRLDRDCRDYLLQALHVLHRR